MTMVLKKNYCFSCNMLRLIYRPLSHTNLKAYIKEKYFRHETVNKIIKISVLHVTVSYFGVAENYVMIIIVR